MKKELLSTKMNAVIYLNQSTLTVYKTTRNIIIINLNVNSIRNRIVAVEEVVRYKENIFL